MVGSRQSPPSPLASGKICPVPQPRPYSRRNDKPFKSKHLDNLRHARPFGPAIAFHLVEFVYPLSSPTCRIPYGPTE